MNNIKHFKSTINIMVYKNDKIHTVIDSIIYKSNVETNIVKHNILYFNIKTNKFIVYKKFIAKIY